jgi:hypothetical protein
MHRKYLGLIATVAAVAALAGYARADSSTSAAQAAPHTHTVVTNQKAANLRVALNRLLGEHVTLAVNATRRGYDGDRDFTASANALDRNSVELANAIGSIYGRKARNQFLNGKLLWRDHIRFFVAYTTALKTNDAAGQRRAVGDLRGYIEAFSAFLSRATGLPQAALRKSITMHVNQLKGQLDAYAAGNHGVAYRLERTAYAHMGMTADTLAAAIVKKFPRKFR